jgi:ketosteroid isomerase-like protein
MFTEDAAILPPNTPIQQGRASIEAWVRTFPPMRDLRIEPTEVVGRSDLAYASGRYSLVVMLPGTPPAPDSGKYIEIWRKQRDGSWKLFRDIFNSDLPLPAPPASARQPARR